MVTSSGGMGVTADWFCPDYWGRGAKGVESGGRGSAWFIETPVGRAVLRHYRRGGLIARFSDRSYLYTGLRSSRSVAELRLLESLKSKALPVPQPIAAFVSKLSPITYHAAIIVGRIPDAVPMSESTRLHDSDFWQELGAIVRRFHNVGLNHVDLNCDNILVSPAGIHLIDFDRCKLMEFSGDVEQQRWAGQNLSRLHRSLTKKKLFTDSLLSEYWSVLMRSYEAPIQD